MANPTFVKDATTLTFKPGSMVTLVAPAVPRQRRLVSSAGTVRILEIDSAFGSFVEVQIKNLQRADIGGFSGSSSLATFLTTTVVWSQNTFTYTDTDGNARTVRFWDPTFGLTEPLKDNLSGKMRLRVEQ